ncbi:MAG TPA: DUF2267 domain-containing protein [Caulobacter sp.]|nr:DUF2267 domain-containing protein [Caulobacter sp.]
MTTGLPVFDTTVQETNRWLARVQAMLPASSRQQAYAATRAVLHVLRDRLPMDAVLGLSAQMPMLMRGLFLEGWRPDAGPTAIRTPEAFRDAVADRLPAGFPRSAEAITPAVFAVLADRIDPGETDKLRRHLPESLRALWPADHPVA